MADSSENIILFVSENTEDFSELFNILKDNNYEILTSKSSTEALSHITYKVPNIIISDTILPDNTGYDFCKKIRSSIKTKLIPFIFIAEEDNDVDRIKAIQQGADAFLTKPINSSELIAYIETKINQFKEFYLLSITDELTRLFNRREFIKKFNTEISANPDTKISLAILDLDFFKQVNDVYGHQMGDIVLMKLAEILKDHTSDEFFPTRFGGEEFVILFPGMNMQDAKLEVEKVRNEFYSFKFNTSDNKSFRVNFSAGVAEYPEIGKNLSILLSRSDQALYAAKKDGRGRTYLFSPVMARNDKFWEYLKNENGFFVKNKFEDAVTSLPFLPELLETITNIEFEISSIGCINVKISPVVNVQSVYGNAVYNYALENIKFIIQKSCENYFASDTYIGISDFYDYEFTILFPSLVDFSLNMDKCKDLYFEISNEIEKRMVYYPLELFYSSDIIYFHKNDPRKLLTDINSVRKKGNSIKEKSSLFHVYTSCAKDGIIAGGDDLSEYLKLDTVKNIKTGQIKYQFINPKNEQYSFISPDIIINNILENLDDVKSFCMYFASIADKSIPILLPLNNNLDYIQQVNIIAEVLSEFQVYCTINEYTSMKLDIKTINDLIDSMPENIHPGLLNCYVGTDILSLLSMCDFEFIGISEHMTRNIHFFRDRIKIINGLKIFVDQMNIDTAAFKITCEEEIQILKDLNILNMSGDFINSDCMCV